MDGEANKVSFSTFSEYIYKDLLNNALDAGITEFVFWDMTLLEIERAIKSKVRMEKVRAKERATFDYIHAHLVGLSIGRMFSSSAEYPPIEQVYPTLFNEEVKAKEQDIVNKKAELSALRFKQFADSHNKKFKGGGSIE